MLGAGFCDGTVGGGDEVLSWEGEDGGVGGASCGSIVFGGDVEGEGEEVGEVGVDVGGEARVGGLAWGVDGEGGRGGSYAVISARCLELVVWLSKSHSPLDFSRRWSIMFWKPPTTTSPSRRAGSCPTRSSQLSLLYAKEIERRMDYEEAHGLVGLHPASQLASRTHWPRGTA